MRIQTPFEKIDEWPMGLIVSSIQLGKRVVLNDTYVYVHKFGRHSIYTYVLPSGTFESTLYTDDKTVWNIRYYRLNDELLIMEAS